MIVGPACPLLISTRRDIHRAVRMERRYAIAEPGDLVLTVGVLVLASGNEGDFPYRRQGWFWEFLGSLDQACTFFAVTDWVEKLARCQTHGQIKEAYEEFIYTTWAANTRNVFPNEEFPIVILDQHMQGN